MNGVSNSALIFRRFTRILRSLGNLRSITVIRGIMLIFRNLLSLLWRHPGHLVWVALAYLPFVDWMSLALTGDQKVYLSTALEMREQGSWLKPILFGEPSYYKPPLQYWATLAGWKVFGFGLAGALIPSCLIALATAWLCGEISKLLIGRREIVSAGLWFGAALGTATFGLTAQMEIYVVFFYAAAWWAGLKFLQQPREGRVSAWLYLAFALAGVGALAKSPLYSVLWVAGFFSFLLITGEWELFRQRRLYGAWLLGVVLGAAWYLTALALDRERFWTDYFLRETWLKKSGNQSTGASLWLALAYFAFPFTLILLPSLRGLFQFRRRPEPLLFVLSAAWAPALFFSLYPYRVTTYLYLLLPVLVVVVDWGSVTVGRGVLFRWLLRISGVGVGLLSLALAAILFRAEMISLVIALAFCVSGSVVALLGWRERLRGFALASLAVVFVYHAAVAELAREDLAGLRSALSQWSGGSLAMLDENHDIWHEVGMLSSSIRQPVKRLHTRESGVDFLRQGGVLILSDAQIQSWGDLGAFDQISWQRWSTRTHFPYRDLILKGKRGIEDFDSRVKRTFVILKSK